MEGESDSGFSPTANSPTNDNHHGPSPQMEHILEGRPSQRKHQRHRRSHSTTNRHRSSSLKAAIAHSEYGNEMGGGGAKRISSQLETARYFWSEVEGRLDSVEVGHNHQQLLWGN